MTGAEIEDGSKKSVKRRDVLKSSGIALASLTTGSEVMAATSSRGIRPNEKQDLFESLCEMYGRKEARILIQDIREKESKEAILTNPELSNARQDYLQFQFARPEERRDIEPEILSAASTEELEQSKQSSRGYIQSDWHNPCYNCGSLDNCSGDWSNEITWYNLQHHINRWGLGSGSVDTYCADLGQYLEKPYGIGGRAYSGAYGGAEVELRLRSPTNVEGIIEPGDDEVIGDIRLDGKSIDASGELNFFRYSEGYFDRDKITTVTTEDETFNAVSSFNFNDGDAVGVELVLNAEASPISPVAWMDYRFNNNRGMWVDDITVS